MTHEDGSIHGHYPPTSIQSLGKVMQPCPGTGKNVNFHQLAAAAKKEFEEQVLNNLLSGKVTPAPKTKKVSGLGAWALESLDGDDDEHAFCLTHEPCSGITWWDEPVTLQDLMFHVSEHECPDDEVEDGPKWVTIRPGTININEF